MVSAMPKWTPMTTQLESRATTPAHDTYNMTAAQGTPNRGKGGKSINLVKFVIFLIFCQNGFGSL